MLVKIFSSIISLLFLGATVIPVFAAPPAWVTHRRDLKNLYRGSGNTPSVKLGRSMQARIINGVVTGISGTTLTVSANGVTYTVDTNSSTIFRRHFWGKSFFSDISVSDHVNIFGKFTDTTKTTILAQMVRDLSVMKRFGTFFGTIQSISGSTIFMQTLRRSSQTVTVSGSTKLINRKEQTIALTDIKVGQKIRVKGLWDQTNSTITQVKQIKDFSLPVVNTPTPTP